LKGDSVFSSFLIGLREGLEAALIVAILVAYLVRTGNDRALSRLWIGVGAAVGLSIALGLALTFVGEELGEQAAEAFAGVTSLLAVGLITWMIFWMATHARHIKAHLHGELDRAIETSAVAVTMVAFFAVVREGLETAIFLWAGIRASGDGTSAVIGALLGLAVAVGLGVLMYRGAVRLNISALFTWTGALLILVAGGILRYAVHEFQELGWLPGEDNIAFDLTGTFPADGIVATFARGLLSLSPSMTWLEVAAWLAYVIPTMIAFVVVIRRRSTPRPVPATSSTTVNPAGETAVVDTAAGSSTAHTAAVAKSDAEADVTTS
jgi:high-affinity iron transporter